MLFHNRGVAFWAAVMRAEVRAARAAVTVGYVLASTQMNQEALRAALQEGPGAVAAVTTAIAAQRAPRGGGA